MERILLIEDEEKIGKITCAYLTKAGFRVDWYQDGQKGWEALQQAEPDLLVLDLMLPGRSGEEICQQIRSQGSPLPILMLTARGEENDRIKGLELGADDYLVKPFSLRELVARIQAILRRFKLTRERVALAEKLTFTSGEKQLELDLTYQKVRIDDELKELTATEFKLLSILAQNPERPFSREDLILKLQGYDYEGFDRTVDAHIKNIRRKLGLATSEFIETIYRVGYKFTERNQKDG